ncbi:hypothetical protein FHS09_001704 [Microbulbifer rhizosphaerae]|uniref:Uncharacterized protein n=1 Tax=Microbulbifer rhizosphaerae TaxID=1562603 RepID=A0A7W4ZA22_9GAMM|nr:hypothetical protein [Microbulbifer rhizosphaerae]
MNDIIDRYEEGCGSGQVSLPTPWEINRRFIR